MTVVEQGSLEITADVVRALADELRVEQGRFTMNDLTARAIEYAYGSLRMLPKMAREDIWFGRRARCRAVLRAEKDETRIWVHEIGVVSPKWMHRDDATPAENRAFVAELTKKGQASIEEAERYERWCRKQKRWAA